MNPLIQVISLLICSNVFMTFAWYAHLKNLNHKPLLVAIFISWMIALLEYMFQVPANRIGFTVGGLSLVQLKIIQEVLTLAVFVPFALLYMGQTLSWNYLYACLCLIGAVYFIFK